MAGFDPSVDFDAKKFINKQAMAARSGPGSGNDATYDAMGNATTPASPYPTPDAPAPSGPRTLGSNVFPVWNPKNGAPSNPTFNDALQPVANAAPAAAAAAPANQPMQNRLPPGVTPHAGIAGVFEVKGPDGSTTYTDNPFGSFNAKGHYTLPMDMGNGSMPKDSASAAGIPQLLPTGQVNPAWIAKNSEMPTEGDFASRGLQLSANKNANVNFRTNSGQYAPRNALTDVDAIGSGAAYRRRDAQGNMVSEAPQLNSGLGGGINPLEAMKTMSDINYKGIEGQQKQAQFTADRRDTIDKNGETAFNSRYESMKDDKSLADDDKRKLAHIETAYDELQRGASPNQLSKHGAAGLQYLTDEAAASANPVFGRGHAPGEVSPSQIGVEDTPLWKRVTSPMSSRSTQLTVRNPDGSTNATSNLNNMSPVMRKFLSTHGDQAQGILPFLNYFQQNGMQNKGQ